jgi:hypothetical protein
MADRTNAMMMARQQAPGLIAEILVNFVLPYVIYVYAAPRLGDVHALMASSLPPVVWSLVEFARKRRVDAISIIVIVGIVLSLLAFIGGGSVRFLQLRENLVGGLVALVFLGSAAIGKPLIYQFVRAGAARQSAEAGAQFAEFQQNAAFRRTMTVMTLVWGFGLLASTVVSCVLVFTMSIPAYLLVSPFIGYGTMGALGLWSFVYGKRAKHRGDARRAAEAAAMGGAGL